MNKNEKTTNFNASIVFQRNTPANSILSIGSQQFSSFTKLSFNNIAKLTGVANPTRETDAVPLQYLRANYLSKNDPNPGYLPIQGGKMTGNINMGTHSIFNLKQPTAPTIQLPPDSEKPSDPSEDVDFQNKTKEEQEAAIADYNTKLAAYQKKISDYNVAWKAFYSEAATVQYINGIVTRLTPNTQLDPANASAKEVEKKIALAQKTLGVEITTPPPPPTIDPTTGTFAPGGSTNPPTTSSTPSYDNLPSNIKNSEFVVTQSDNTLTGDLKMTNAQISNIKTPADSGEDNYAANVTYLESKLKQPKRTFISNTFSQTTISGHIPWLSTTSGSTSEPDFKTTDSDQYFETTQENLKIKTAGLLVLSVRGTWNGSTSGGNTQTPATFPVSLTVTPDTTGGGGSTGSATTLTLPITLHSGNSVMMQLPITAAAQVKIAPSTTSGGSGTTPSTLSSWSWEAALYPIDVTSTTTSP